MDEILDPPLFMGIIKPNLINKLFILVFGKVKNQVEAFYLLA
jgi:hypothetical protein